MSSTKQQPAYHKNQRVIRVAKTYSCRRLSSGRLLAMAAVSPQGSSDPVDVALAASLATNRPDIELIQVDPAKFAAATPNRKYSLATTENFSIDKQKHRLVIMRGDVKAVLKEAKCPREERTLFLRNVEYAERFGQRCLAVASADIAPDGSRGEFHLEGFVALSLETIDALEESVAQNPNQWVRVNLWSATLRFQHWANMFLIIAMTITGYFIMDPAALPQPAPGSDTGYLMGWVRLIHYVSGFSWLVLGLSRLVLAFTAKDRQLRWRSLWPLNSMRDVKGLIGTIRYYAFIDRHGPLYLAHNPLQQLSYTGIYAMCLIQMLTGLTLYALANQTNWLLVALAYPAHLLGIPAIRLIHSIIMFILWAFVIIHVYLAVRADSVERHGGVSSMINGGVWLRRGAKPMDAPKVG